MNPDDAAQKKKQKPLKWSHEAWEIENGASLPSCMSSMQSRVIIFTLPIRRAIVIRICEVGLLDVGRWHDENSWPWRSVIWVKLNSSFTKRSQVLSFLREEFFISDIINSDCRRLKEDHKGSRRALPYPPSARRLVQSAGDQTKIPKKNTLAINKSRNSIDRGPRTRRLMAYVPYPLADYRRLKEDHKGSRRTLPYPTSARRLVRGRDVWWPEFHIHLSIVDGSRRIIRGLEGPFHIHLQLVDWYNLALSEKKLSHNHHHN